MQIKCIMRGFNDTNNPSDYKKARWRYPGFDDSQVNIPVLQLRRGMRLGYLMPSGPWRSQSHPRKQARSLQRASGSKEIFHWAQIWNSWYSEDFHVRQLRPIQYCYPMDSESNLMQRTLPNKLRTTSRDRLVSTSPCQPPVCPGQRMVRSLSLPWKMIRIRLKHLYSISFKCTNLNATPDS